jgi:4-amino-4-deoxy-L-arabinose transferase-like glycosyltransferase
MALLGPTETAARLPSAVAALAVIAATAWFARRLLTLDAATTAALLVTTSPGVLNRSSRAAT